MGLYGVPVFMSLLGFGIGMMFASFHMCVMMLLRYANPSDLNVLFNSSIGCLGCSVVH